MPSILISACLFGCSCRYDGKTSADKLPDGMIDRIREKFTLIPVCPEQLGGLPTPRPPAEIRNLPDGVSVLTANGTDVTENYRRGAEEMLKIALGCGCRHALLKERSPSCGSGKIYDGSFCGRLTDGSGVTAALLRENGIAIIGESAADKLLEEQY